VAYILAICLAESLGKSQDLIAPLLELFTLGTIADLAPLTGVNRRWVQLGLKLLPKSQLTGVQALVQVSGLSSEKSLKPEAIGFRLGPRINAIGRIADPQIIIELFTTEDEGQALELAMKCEQVNKLRQRLCELIEQEAIAWCEQSGIDLQKERVLLIVQPEWHHGVIGIVASRLLERYGVPVFIGTYEENDPTRIRGSARGIPEFNIFEALEFCDDLLDKYGGHRAAGGFSFPAQNLEAVRSRLSQFANQHLQLEHLKPLVKIDAEAEISDITLSLYEKIDELHPCGMENPDPVFWTSNVRVVEQQAIGQNQAHLKVLLAKGGGAGIKAIAWRWGEYRPIPSLVDVAYRLRLNEWHGTKSVELELIGIRLPSEMLQPELLVKSVEANKPALARVEFYYDSLPYLCSISQVGASKELRIRNPEGQVLAIQPQQRRGLLGTSRNDAQEVDISQPYYFNLIQAALTALELIEQGQRIQEKEWLIAEKDQKIAQLSEQLNQQMRSPHPAAELPTTELPIAPVNLPEASLELQTPDPLPPEKILDSSPWLCLSPQSQKDLIAACKLANATELPDYVAAAALLCNAVERDVVQALFKKLYQFLKDQGISQLGGIPIKARKKYTLEVLPPLLSAEWRSLHLDKLAQPELPTDLYSTVTVKAMSDGDRQLLQNFLTQWDYPIAPWLLHQPAEAAARIDQIYKLRMAATVGAIGAWQFELLRSLVTGESLKH
jgi:single-stranded-DNA-specific exonuclease